MYFVLIVSLQYSRTFIPSPTNSCFYLWFSYLFDFAFYVLCLIFCITEMWIILLGQGLLILFAILTRHFRIELLIGTWSNTIQCHYFITIEFQIKWFQEPFSGRGVHNTTLCDKVCQWLAAGQWFSPSTSWLHDSFIYFYLCCQDLSILRYNIMW